MGVEWSGHLERLWSVARWLACAGPPPAGRAWPGRERPPSSPLRWLATGGGLGAWTVYSPGAVLGVTLVIWIVWSTFLFSGARSAAGEPVGTAPAALLLLYVALAGFRATRRTRSIWAGAAVGALTAVIAAGAALLTFAIVDGALGDLAAAPLVLPVAAHGFVVGAVGSALALPRTALRALLDGIRD
jgi:hypothetical protein